jgi:deoxyadenosine/deoxycytidine kinase
MSDSPDSILTRIQSRNRPYEQRIQIQTIRSLSESYDTLFANWKTCPVIRLSVADFDARVPTNIEKLKDELKFYLAKR